MAGQNSTIHFHTFPSFSKAEDHCDLCEGDAAQAERSPYLEAGGHLSSPRVNGQGEINLKEDAEDYVLYCLVYVILASVAILVVSVVATVFLL
jgi:hypothetical protein